MSIADKLTTIAENQQRVYDAGYAVADRHGQITANLRYQEGLEEGYQNGYQNGIVDGESLGISQGELNAYNDFWDTYQQNGNRRNYFCGFGGVGWTDKHFKPKYPIIATAADYMFYSADVTDINVPIRLEVNSFQQAFRSSTVKNVQEIILTKPTHTGSWFSYCNTIEEIRITCEGEGCLGRTHVACMSSTFSHDSLVSIINALQDLVPLGVSYQFEIGSTNKAKLSTAEIAIATQKGWSVV